MATPYKVKTKVIIEILEWNQAWTDQQQSRRAKSIFVVQWQDKNLPSPNLLHAPWWLWH